MIEPTLKKLRFLGRWLDPEFQDVGLGRYVQSYDALTGLVGLCGVLSLICAVALVAVIVGSNRWPVPSFVGVTPSHAQVALPVVADPVYSIEKVQRWSEEAVESALSFNFVNYHEQLEKSEIYFTPDGWAAFYAALQHSKVLANVKGERLQVWLTPLSDARIVGSCVRSSCLYKLWRVEIPAVITYTGAAPQTARKVLISLLVLQVPTTVNANGMAISQMIVQEVH